jgi:hypothetical protein
MDNLPDLHLTTPKKISIGIKSFFKKMSLPSQQRLLKFQILSANYLTRHCLSNCETEHTLHGTPIVFGWTIWEDNNYFIDDKRLTVIDAEYHAVLRINNELVDITPRTDGEELIMFLPDPQRTAKRIDSHTWE